MKERFDYLDGLRGIAALIVVIHHGMILFDFGIYSGVPAEAKFQPWDLWLAGQTFLALPVAGNYSVMVFFVLSGFVLAGVYSRTRMTVPQLVAKRYVRLLVPVAAASLLALIVGLIALGFPALHRYVAIVAGASSPAFTLPNIAGALALYVQESFVSVFITGIHAPTFNGVLWTMQIEFIGSCLMIGTFWISKKVAPTSAQALATLLMAMFLILDWYSQLSLFAAGGILFWLFGRAPLRVSWLFGVAGLCLIVAGIYLGTMPQGPNRPDLQVWLLRWLGFDPNVLLAKSPLRWVPLQFLPVGVWHGLGAAMLLAGVLMNCTARKVLTLRWVLFLGFISFPLYLIQANVRDLTAAPSNDLLLWLGIDRTAAMLTAVAIFVVASIVVSYVFARIVEWRALAWSDGLARLIHRLSPWPHDPSASADAGGASKPTPTFYPVQERKVQDGAVAD